MKPIRTFPVSSLVFTLFILASGLSVAEVSPPIALENACGGNERTVWSCNDGSQNYALCTSNGKASAKSYLQYRVATPTETEFVFPRSQRPAAEVFRYRLFSRVGAIQFENEGYQYSIYESINGEASIEVVKEDKQVAAIECNVTTDTLTLTPTIEKFEAMGIYR